MPHYFSLGDRIIPGRQKIAGDTCGQSHLQPPGELVTGLCQSEQCSVGMVWCLKAQAGASDNRKPTRSQAGDTPWGTAWPLLRPAATSFSAAPSLTLKVRRAKQHLCPHFAHLYRENTWVEGSALLTKPKITRRPSISEERRIIFLLSRAKAGHKLALCKQRQALYSLDNLLQIICPALLINAAKHLEG